MNPIEHRKENATAAEKWLRGIGATPSELGIRACVLLALWQSGFHHIPHAKRVNWHAEGCIIAWGSGDFATADFNYLTQLVFLAHDECLRVELRPPETAENPDTDAGFSEDQPTGIRLFISARERTGEFYELHPTLEGAVAKYRETFPAELAHTESGVAA